MAKTPDYRLRANVKYNASRDNIMIRPTKEDGARIRAAAASAGQSVQAYVLQACAERIKRDETKVELHKLLND